MVYYHSFLTTPTMPWVIPQLDYPAGSCDSSPPPCFKRVACFLSFFQVEFHIGFHFFKFNFKNPCFRYTRAFLKSLFQIHKNIMVHLTALFPCIPGVIRHYQCPLQGHVCSSFGTLKKCNLLSEGLFTSPGSIICSFSAPFYTCLSSGT